MSSLIAYSATAFLAGILLNLTPCVLPVIPLKVQTVLREINSDRWSRILAAGALMAGSLSFFLILAGAAVYLGLTWGGLFQSKQMLAFLSFFLLAAAVATLFDRSIPLPQKLYQIPIRRYTGAYLTGAMAGILSTPCTGPFLGSVLAYTLTRPWWITLTIYSAIAVGLAAPYVLVLLWPGLAKRFQFSGHWTLQVKIILGFLLLAGALFFGQTFITPKWRPMLWGVEAALLCGWAILQLRLSTQWNDRWIPITGMIVALGLMTAAVFPAHHLAWQQFSNKRLQLSLKENQPVLIEFTAEWCLNCEVLEKTTYTNKKVIHTAQTSRLVPLRVDMTDFNAEHKALLTRFGGTALPFAVLLASDGKIVHTFSGLFSANALVEAIQQLSSP